MNKLKDDFKKNGFVVIKVLNDEPIRISKDILSKSKHRSCEGEKNFNLETLKLQKKLYDKKIHLKILQIHKTLILKVLGLKDINDLYISSFFHLRAVKKTKDKINNFVGIHRETFYSDYSYTKHQINISVPLMNYNFKNSMKVINRSHKIDDNMIEVKKLNSKQSGTKKFSLRHKLGFPYNPKKIIKGVDLKKAKRVKLKTGSLLIFSSMLLHGNGSNGLKNIRYSIDFGIIEKKFLKKQKIKKHHVSYKKNRDYWIKIPKLS